LDSKGNTRIWGVEVINNTVIVKHGILDGKIQTKDTICKAKNIGKSNETTPQEQAILEAQSKWTKQILREDYAENIEDCGKQTRPMLALDYRKVPHRVNWSVAIMQPKIDGVRLLCGFHWDYKDFNEFETMSRKGDSYYLPHIQEDSKKTIENCS
jgi:hypothetical protein